MLFIYLLFALAPVWILILLIVLAVKTSPNHPKKTGRTGSEVSNFDYILNNWDLAEEDPNYNDKTKNTNQTKN